MEQFAYLLFYRYSYVFMVLPVVIISMIIQAKMKSTYSKYAKVGNMRRITGAQAAQLVLEYYGIHDVQIRCVQGKLTDHYDPRTKIIALSPEVFNNPSIAAVGIACHEAGHAAQHAENYGPIKVRNLILPVCNVGSSLSFPLIIIGLLFFSGSSIGGTLVWAGILLYAFVAVFQLVTLPVEFNASNRALQVIENNGLLNYEEKTGAARVLRAAAMTYVAALAVSLVQLLRLILVFGRRNR